MIHGRKYTKLYNKCLYNKKRGYIINRYTLSFFTMQFLFGSFQRCFAESLHSFLNFQ